MPRWPIEVGPSPGRLAWALAVVHLVAACSAASGGALDRSAFVDDPVFAIEVEGAVAEEITDGPIGGAVTNDRGYQAERRWTGVSPEAFRQQVADLAATTVRFHRMLCRERGPTLTGTKTLDSGLVASVKVRYLPEDVATVGLTGIDPEQPGAGPLVPPTTIEIEGECDDPALLAAAGLT